MTDFNYDDNRFLSTFTPEQIKKVRERPKLPDGVYVPIGIGNVKSRDPNDKGTYGLNCGFVPLPEVTSPMTDAKRAYTMYGSFLAWFKDPADKRKKASNTYGIFEEWVRAAQPTMPSDGTSLPPIAIRDQETDELVNSETLEPLSPDKKEARAIANAMAETRIEWIQKLYSQYLLAAEKRVNPHPMVGWTCYGKVSLSKGEDGTIYANVGRFRAELPEDEPAFDLKGYKPAGEDEDEDETDEG